MAQHRTRRDVDVTVSGGLLDISWGGLPRMTAGAPAIQGAKNTGDAGCIRVNPSKFTFTLESGKHLGLLVRELKHRNIAGLFMLTDGNRPHDGNDYMGFFFKGMPGYKEGVSYWSIKDWNPWTKPVRVERVTDFPDHGVQFFLWRYEDGTYGAAMPLSGHGYETALGRSDSGIGAKSVSGFTGAEAAEIPMMAIGFGKDPYALISDLYHDGLLMIGRGADLRVNKKYPKVFDYFGWCSWNASDLGRNVGSALLTEAAKSFHDNHFPLSWMIVDDGWLQKDSNGALVSYTPNPDKFPGGFKPVITRLKKEYGIKYVGVWHTINGYWNGIDSASALGREYGKDLFTWSVKNGSGKTIDFHFVSPYTKALERFYANWYRYLKGEGVDFVKVDNQLSIPQMSRGKFPVFEFAKRIHEGLNGAVDKYFGGAIINCMDMGNNAFYNFGSTALARASEDYFPYEPGESYDIMRGNAAVHVLGNITNSLWFGQMVYPDYDEFESYNPNAVFHAIARAISDGPVYVTDKPGKQDFAVLRPLVYNNGRIIRTDMPARPTEDCLFQVQDPKPFKAFSMSGKVGLLAVWNVADADSVTGAFKPSDVHGIQGEKFFVYEYFSKSHEVMERDQSMPLKLGRMGYRLYYVSPIENGFAPIGLVDKYNAPGTIEKVSRTGSVVTVKVGEGGAFVAYSSVRPKKVTVNGGETLFDYGAGIVSVKMEGKLRNPVIRMSF